MNDIYSTYLNNFEAVKAAKESYIYKHVGNHPHRVQVIRLTGSINYVYDGRGIAKFSTSRKELNVDLANLPEYTRKFVEKIPARYSPNLNVYEFSALSLLREPWGFRASAKDRAGQLDLPEKFKVGECKETNYTRDSEEDNWEILSSGAEDVYCYWSPRVFSVGGHPNSGGRGDDTDENSVSFYLNGEFTGDPDGPIGDVLSFNPFRVNYLVYRLPWVDPWENESELYSELFDDWIAEQNADDGGGWTGSTTMTLEFS
jgi:hypothetical protein